MKKKLELYRFEFLIPVWAVGKNEAAALDAIEGDSFYDAFDIGQTDSYDPFTASAVTDLGWLVTAKSDNWYGVQPIGEYNGKTVQEYINSLEDEEGEEDEDEDEEDFDYDDRGARRTDETEYAYYQYLKEKYGE
jgi:hypothetical protein